MDPLAHHHRDVARPGDVVGSDLASRLLLRRWPRRRGHGRRDRLQTGRGHRVRRRVHGLGRTAERGRRRRFGRRRGRGGRRGAGGARLVVEGSAEASARRRRDRRDRLELDDVGTDPERDPARRLDGAGADQRVADHRPVRGGVGHEVAGGRALDREVPARDVGRREDDVARRIAPDPDRAALADGELLHRPVRQLDGHPQRQGRTSPVFKGGPRWLPLPALCRPRRPEPDLPARRSRPACCRRARSPGCGR